MVVLSLRTSVLSFMTFLFIGCASGPCRGIVTQKKLLSTEGVFEEDSEQNSVLETVKVYKYDGSLQCGMGRVFPLKEMSSQLAGIKIYSMISRPDGLMHITVCGSPTGQANVYEIEKKDLKKALELEFELWSFDQ